MKRLIFFLSIISFGLYSTEISLHKYDFKKGCDICVIDPKLKALYMESFSHVYRDHWTEDFAQEFANYFDDSFENLKHSEDMLLVVAKKDDHAAGWILFLLHEQSAIIDIICVDPTLQKQGIGKSLVFSIKNYVPKVKTISLVTNRINKISPFFYERLGFVKTNFMRPGYEAGMVQGYELNIN